MPTIATSNADQPTSSISSKFDSRPTSKRSSMTPISASAPITTSVFNDSAAVKPASMRLPTTMPPSSSPKTAGWFILSKNSPPSFATSRMTATPTSTCGSSPTVRASVFAGFCAEAVASAHRACAADNTRSTHGATTNEILRVFTLKQILDVRLIFDFRFAIGRSEKLLNRKSKI